ncbi:hypothetical protein QTP70_009920 [Hemibagrus guttatus]|uniref:Retrotransposon gag domain-containing protein n=1 Tax=Hemibagrus guttatus TaxID=175788 RepID=A0AAE0QBW0_9TELE|nr:hypothetical protein QTP70_009920 [Hemibagrus guttatus]
MVALAEAVEKYNQVMESNAQLENEKSDLMDQMHKLLDFIPTPQLGFYSYTTAWILFLNQLCTSSNDELLGKMQCSSRMWSPNPGGEDCMTPGMNTSTLTDPAELHEIIVRQGAIIRSYQDQVEVLQSRMCGVSTAAPRDPPSARSESPRLALPEKFDGSADRCRGFLRQCEVFFSHQLGMYHEEGTKCAFLLSLMTNRALEWASAVWDADPQVRSSFSYFAGMIWEVFEYPTGGKDISVQLTELRQGSEATADYAIRFCTLEAQSGWNDVALWAVFCAGLNPVLQAELACHVEATTLSQFVATAIPTSGGDPSLCRSSPPDEVVLQLRGLRKPESSVSREVFVGSALIDSGATINLIDGALVEELGIPTFPCVPSLRITAIDSQPIGEGYLKCQTELLEF